MTRPRLLLAAVTLLAVALAAVSAVLLRGPSQRHLAADFPNTINLYPGAQVKVLGVPIGSVDQVEVRGTTVHVDISYPDTVALPASVHAAIVPPSIVGDRFIQLTPPYTGGPILPDNATLSPERTQVPLELDQTYRALDNLATALGPNGANSHGALSTLLTQAAANLSGNGDALHNTIHQLSGATDTLAASRDNIAGTVTNLADITGTLAGDDTAVRALIDNLATVSSQLNNQRDELRGATTNLNLALSDISEFLNDNRSGLTTDIAGLRQITTTLADHQHDLAAVLDVTPLGLSNVLDLTYPINYDPEHLDQTKPAGRATAIPGKFDGLLANLPNQLGYSLSALCGQLPASQQRQLAPTCTALQQTGSALGGLLRHQANPLFGPSLGTRQPGDLAPLLTPGPHR